MMFEVIPWFHGVPWSFLEYLEFLEFLEYAGVRWSTLEYAGVQQSTLEYIKSISSVAPQKVVIQVLEIMPINIPSN